MGSEPTPARKIRAKCKLAVLLFSLFILTSSLYLPSRVGNTRAALIAIRLNVTVRENSLAAPSSYSISPAGVNLSVYFSNGTLAGSGTTDSTGTHSFVVASGYRYIIFASTTGYDDSYYDTSSTVTADQSIFISLNIAFYHGTILAHAYTTQARYNPGDSGQLIVAMFNQNSSFALNITSAQVLFPWYVNNGLSATGYANLTGLPQIVSPRHGINWTVPFTIPNDGTSSYYGGRIFFFGTAQAWKTVWSWNATANAPQHSKALTTVSFDGRYSPYNNGNDCTYVGEPYCGGFVRYLNINNISYPSYDTSGGLPTVALYLQALLAMFVVNVVLTALLLWRRSSPK